ncbi:MAG: hypothetical protein MUE81_14695 [Thermoflexibacter sp.]|nr:hypothetical protein [Thermoflexibacter sp.]
MQSKYVITALCFAALVSLSCLWDKDTIEMERQEFPDTYELIIGKFLRHSPEFYQWRVQDRERRIKQSPDSVRLYDDLAVAYSKLHNDKKAIQLMFSKDSIQPNLYETYANLGTFYIHDGQFAEGLKYIKKAIQINPNAHFGREVYQQYVVEYILQKFPNGKIELPVNDSLCDCYGFGNQCPNFYALLLEKYNATRKQKERDLPYKEFEKALNGVQGMMKFGNYDSPVLLEVLGDLLISVPSKEIKKRDDYAPARHLAVRAYVKASKEAKSSTAKQIYLKKAWNTLCVVQEYDGGNEQMKKEYEQNVIASLEKGIAEGNQFYNEIRNNEMKWIAQGINPDAKFDQVYYKKVKANKVKNIPPSPFRGDEEKATQEETIKKEVVETESSSVLPIAVALLVVLGIVTYAWKRFSA